MLLLCVSLTFTASASGGGGEKDKKSTLPEQQDPKPQDVLPKFDEEPASGGVQLEADQEEIAESDSTQSSFRKFNFIFYFLYKFKYENDSRFGAIPPELESN